MRNIIWDLDGTLVDSEAENLHYLKIAMLEASFDVSAQLKPIRIGPPIDIMLKESFPAEMLTDEIINMVVANYRKQYDNSGFPMTKPFDGIEEIISDTINFTHYIITNKPNPASGRIVEKMGWANKISILKAQHPNKDQRKPKTELFSELITEVGADISSFTGIGDVKGDGIAARNNNITAAGVLWGAGTREELDDCCDYVFENVKQLREFLYERIN